MHRLTRRAVCGRVFLTLLVQTRQRPNQQSLHALEWFSRSTWSILKVWVSVQLMLSTCCLKRLIHLKLRLSLHPRSPAWVTGSRPGWLPLRLLNLVLDSFLPPLGRLRPGKLRTIQLRLLWTVVRLARLLPTSLAGAVWFARRVVGDRLCPAVLWRHL